MTWEIVVGIITLLGCVITVSSLVSNNTKAMTEMKCAIDELNITMKEQGNDIKTLQKSLADIKLKVHDLEVQNK